MCAMYLMTSNIGDLKRVPLNCLYFLKDAFFTGSMPFSLAIFHQDKFDCDAKVLCITIVQQD